MSIELVSFNLCPFVQRSVILLREKGIDYDITYIDLADKPDWFVAMSPLGKVPLLKVDGKVLFESNVIAEYLDEVHGPQLHPADPLDKAVHRAWIEVVSQLGGPGYLTMVRTEEADVRKAAAAANAILQRLEAVIVGPCFAGEQFALIDAAAAPMLQRLYWAHRIAPELGIFDEVPKALAWTEALLARPSVQGSLIPGIDEVYLDYIRGGGSPTRKAPASWLGTRSAA